MTDAAEQPAGPQAPAPPAAAKPAKKPPSFADRIRNHPFAVMLGIGVVVASTTLGVTEYFQSERTGALEAAHKITLQERDLEHEQALEQALREKRGVEAELAIAETRNNALVTALDDAKSWQDRHDELRDTLLPPQPSETALEREAALDPIKAVQFHREHPRNLTAQLNLTAHFTDAIHISRNAAEQPAYRLATADADRLLADPDFTLENTATGDAILLVLLAPAVTVDDHALIHRLAPHFLFERSRIETTDHSIDSKMRAFIEDFQGRRSGTGIDALAPSLTNVRVMTHGIVAHYQSMLSEVRRDGDSQAETVILNEMVLYFEARTPDERWLYRVRARFASDDYDYKTAEHWKSHVELRWRQLHFVTGLAVAQAGRPVAPTD
ncbi:MAG: hypothetical protein AAGC92_05450 [Pseudomonadota bacterium]